MLSRKRYGFSNKFYGQFVKFTVIRQGFIKETTEIQQQKIYISKYIDFRHLGVAAGVQVRVLIHSLIKIGVYS